MHKTALITGAAVRIGKAMAEHLADEGWNIAVHYNASKEPAENLVHQLSEKFPLQRFRSFGANLMSDQETEKLVETVTREMGKFHLLVNNASVFEPSSLLKTTVDFWDEQMTVNCKAPFILSRDFSHICSEGVIINLVDTRITTNRPAYAAYTLSKKTLWEFTKMAALEWGPSIRVNAIAPGLTLAPAEKEDDYLWNLAREIPMKRPGGLEPILKNLDFILGNDYLTGQLLFCDGGEHIGL